MEKWNLSEDELRGSKLFCIHGLKLSNTVQTIIKVNTKSIKVTSDLEVFEKV